MLFSLKFNTYQWISRKLLYGWTKLYDVVLYFHVFSICVHSSIEPGVSADKCLRKLPGYTYLAFQVCYKPILHPKKSPLRLILESFGLSWIQNKISLTHARCRQWFKRGHLPMTSATKTHSLKGRGIEQSCDYKTHHKVLRTRHSCHNCIPCHRIMWKYVKHMQLRQQYHAHNVCKCIVSWYPCKPLYVHKSRLGDLGSMGKARNIAFPAQGMPAELRCLP